MITELEIAADHPAFAGHFPGLPLFPGAALLDAVLWEIARSRSLDLRQWLVASVKFLDIVGPGTTLTLEHTTPDETSMRFAVRNAHGTVASGVLSAIAVTGGH